MPGLVALIAVGAAYDAYALARKRQTISCAIRHLRRTPVGNAMWLVAVAAAVDHFERRG